MRIALAFAGALLALPASTARADEAPPTDDEGRIVLSRAYVLRRAASRNPQVASTRAEVLRAQAQQGQVRAARFPDVEVVAAAATSLQADLVDDQTNGVQSTRSAYDFDLGRDLSVAFGGQITVIQPLYTFGKIDLRADAAERAERAARAQVEMTQADVALEAAKLYEGHLYAKAVLLFVSSVEDIAKKSLEETEFLLEEGSPDVKPQDKLRLQAALGVAALARHRAEAGLDQSREGLRAYLDLPDDAEIVLEDEYQDPIATAPTRLETLVATALERRPEMRALENGIAAYQSLADAERADYYPDFFVMGYMSAAYTPGRDWVTSRYVLDPLGHFLPGALVGARWTIQWDMAGERAKEVEADATKLAGLLEWAKTGVPAEVNKIYRDLEQARRDIEQLEQTLPLTKQWMVRASADYGAGLGPSSELTDAVQAYALLKTSELEAVYKLNVALAELAKATGTLVDGDSTLYPGPPKKKDE